MVYPRRDDFAGLTKSTGPTMVARLRITSTEVDLGTLQSRLVFRTVVRLYPDAERSTLRIYITTRARLPSRVTERSRSIPERGS